MYVYRIEHRINRAGPYCAGRHDGIVRALAYRLCDTHSGSNGHPVFKYHGARSAMPSIESLKKWFKGFLRELNRHGFVIRVFDTECYTQDNRAPYQILFDPSTAKLVKEIKILSRETQTLIP